MKNSKEYGPKVTKLFKTLKKAAEPVMPPTYADPAEAIVYAFVSIFTTANEASKIFKRMNTHFVDINDLRVSRLEEILEIFGDSSDRAAAAAQSMVAVLNGIFEKHDKVSLASLAGEGKRQARKEIEEIPGMTPFVAAYTFLTALGGHAIPLTEAMVDYFRQKELVYPGASEQDIVSFLERQIAASDAYAFYALFRAETEGGVKPEARTDTGARAKKNTSQSAASKPSKKKKAPKK